jgi:hypothetical protein
MLARLEFVCRFVSVHHGWSGQSERIDTAVLRTTRSQAQQSSLTWFDERFRGSKVRRAIFNPPVHPLRP